MKRSVITHCGGIEFVVDVESVVQHISIQLSFMWRPIAVESGKLPKLFCEDMVLDGCVPESTIDLDDSLSSGPTAARNQCNAAFKEFGALTGAQTSSTIKRTQAQYSTIDPDFDADVQLIMSVCGANSQSRLMMAILKECPIVGVVKTAEQVLHAVSAMVNDNVYKLASKPAQVRHGAFKTVLCSIVNEVCPDISTINADPAMHQLTKTLKNFATFRPASGAGEAAPVKYGLDALKAMRDAVKEQADNNVVIRDSDVSAFRTHMYLIPLTDRAKYTELIDLAKRDVSAKLKKAAAKKKTGHVSAKDKAVSEAMAMFC